MEENITIDAEEVVVDSSAVAEAEDAEVAVPHKKEKKPINQQKLQDNLWGWIFCIPLIVGTVWFVYSAFIMAVLISFTDYSIGGVSENIFTFLGSYGKHIYSVYPTDDLGYEIFTAEKISAPLYWYSQIFTQTITVGTNIKMNEMGAYLFNTVFYMIGIPIGMVLSMFFAVCMSRDIKGGNLFRVLYYIPCVASTISIVYTFKIMFGTNGVINNLLGIKLDWLNPPGVSTAQTWNSLLDQRVDNDFMNNP